MSLYNCKDYSLLYFYDESQISTLKDLTQIYLKQWSRLWPLIKLRTWAAKNKKIENLRYNIILHLSQIVKKINQITLIKKTKT